MVQISWVNVASVIFGGVQGAVAIAGGREELFRKKFLSPPCTPLTLQKPFRRDGFVTDIVTSKSYILSPFKGF